MSRYNQSTPPLTKTDKTKIELRTARDLDFFIDKERGIGTVPRFTKCHKPKYNKEIKRYLARMEDARIDRPASNPPGVCVFLEGMLRYVWRTDVLTEGEYDVIRKEDRANLGVLGKKRKGPVGESRPLRGGNSS